MVSLVILCGLDPHYTQSTQNDEEPYSFHLMVFLTPLFLFVFLACLYFIRKDTLPEKTWFLRLGVLSFFLGMIASQSGWIVAEVGRQPWIIQDMMPVHVGASHISVGNVKATFFIFLALFTLLLLAEVKIMLRQIQAGPKEA